MKNTRMFLLNLLMAGIRFGLLLLVSVLLIVIGAIADNGCLDVGIAILVFYLLLCLIPTIRIQRAVSSLSAEDPEFGGLIEQIMGDPKGFVSEKMEEQNHRRELHGEDLLALSDDELHDTVWYQNLEISEGADAAEIDAFSGARKTVYVLDLFDSEIQNGGLCQFFVNSSAEVAPFVSESLEMVGAVEHKRLFDEFVSANKIDLSELSSFRAWSHQSYIRQTKRFNFDAFDDRYYELPALQELVIAFIRANITQF